MTRWIAAAVFSLALGACEFERAQNDDDALMTSNSCTTDNQCANGATCVSGLCVASSADAELEVTLQVTPLPAGDSDAPHPVLYEGLKVKMGPLMRRVDLPQPVTASGTIRNDGVALDAMLSFTPMRTIKGIAAAPVTVSTTRDSSLEDHDYAVQLSDGASYSVLVRPVDTSLPPYRTTFVAADGEGVSVDYAQLATRSQTFLLQAPAERTLLVRAFDLASDEPISSTAMVQVGKATVVFASEPVPYRLEIRAEQSYEPTQSVKAEGIFCDDDTPVYPVYSIMDSELGAKDRNGAIALDLPQPPARIRYEGTVELCDEALAAQTLVSELPVTFHSKELRLPEDSKFTAAFEAKTTAQLDPSSKTRTLGFCVQLMEGDYDVLVTPPTSTPCAIYAETRAIDAPNGTASSGAQLTLGGTASLRGTLLTSDQMPLAGATVEAVALGRANPIEGDPTLTRYNRSRQAVSEANGVFSVPVDLGTYDLLIKPPASSGFSWQVRHDVGVGSRREFSRIVDMSSPVMLSGRLAYPSSDAELAASLAGAEVLAYAIIADTPVPGGDVAGERAVAIGKATAEADGAFMLLLPQSVTAEF